jgi:hypothetical protein
METGALTFQLHLRVQEEATYLVRVQASREDTTFGDRGARPAKRLGLSAPVVSWQL